jgi:tRNA-methyltransferase O
MIKPKRQARKGVRTSEAQCGELRVIGVIRSPLKERSKAPRQATEGAPYAWLEVYPFALQALDGLKCGDQVIVLTWLHRAQRDVLKVHPRSEPGRRLTGVFATRSPDRRTRSVFSASSSGTWGRTACGSGQSKQSMALP